jgi:TonB family protein
VLKEEEMFKINRLNKIDLVLVSLCIILAAGWFIAHRDFAAPSHRELVFSSTETVVKSVPQTKSAVIEVAAPLPVPQTAVLPIIPPKVVSSILPQYPASVLEEGIEGVTILQVYVEPSGRASDISVAQTSGNTLLDQAAREAVKTWVFQAASQGGGAIASCLQVPIRFNLRE